MSPQLPQRGRSSRRNDLVASGGTPDITMPLLLLTELSDCAVL